MNKHQKLAFFIAPFLLILGYVASDYYLAATGEKKVIALKLDGSCQPAIKKCLLLAEALKLNLYQEHGQVIVNATHALDDLVLFVVKTLDGTEKAKGYQLKALANKFYWGTELDLFSVNKESKSDNRPTLRIIANIQGHQYISEFKADF